MRHITPSHIRHIWRDKYEWDRTTVINKERQHYLPINASNSNIAEDADEGSVLQMTAIREDVTLASVTQPYSSAVFISQGKDYVKTGQYVEARLKMPGNKGIFPAFWLLRKDPVWQKTEIDVVEGIYDINDDRYHIAFHSHVDAGKTYQKLGESIKGNMLTSEFNDFGVYIDEYHVDYYLNRELVGSTPLHKHEQGLEYYMLLNLAVADEKSWAAGADTVEPYGWQQAHLYCAGINIFDGPPPEYEEIDDGPGPAQLDFIEPSASAVEEIDMVTQVIRNDLYRDSNSAAKFFYGLARACGGKL